VKTPITIAREALDFTKLIRAGETVGWAEATAEPVFLTRMLDVQAERCPPFSVFFALTFSEAFAAGHANVTVTALGGASAGRRFFACGANNVVPVNISDVSSLVATGRLPIDIVLLQISGPDETGRYNAGLGIEHLHAAIGRARLVIRATSYTHDALVLGNFRRFIAINGALEVDLTGQVNAETAGGQHIGLVGGQMDFVRAANRAPEGRSIIALQSTNRERTRSRIVAELVDGVVTTPRAEADLVVTEHGIAELRGRTLGERARALVAIADPRFRSELERASERLV
jgi:acyl-CoA hydrolase